MPEVTWLKIPPVNGKPALPLSTVRQRITQAKKIDGCSPTLTAWQQEDGTIIVVP